jgi:type IV pilus assembly protein PilC
MSTYAYTALDAKGKVFEGNIQEKTWTRAIRRVKEMGLFPTSVKEQTRRAILERLKPAKSRAAPTDQPSRSRQLFGRIPVQVITAFTRQLATLIEAGIPLLKGLRAIEQQEENPKLRNVLRKVMADIEGGSTLAEALSRQPKVFNRTYISMIIAGESAGMLESTLGRLADFMERAQKIRSKIVSSMFYPAAVISVATAVLILMTVWIIPRFKEVFADVTGARRLPAFTEFVLGTSEFIKSHFLHAIGSVLVLAILFKLTKATNAGRLALDRLKLRLPVFGRIIRKATICRFARTLGTMLENGVPVLQALLIARETTRNALFAQAITRSHDGVKEGENLTSTLQASGIFPSTVLSMIDVGEQTGALPDMLLKVADTYETEVDNSISAALSLLEPVLIVFLALVVGSVVVAMFLPIIAIINGGGVGANANDQ